VKKVGHVGKCSSQELPAGDNLASTHIIHHPPNSTDDVSFSIIS
jgi:hypothetical protein